MEKCVNGNDLVAVIGNKAVGHCSSHTCNISTETKDLAFKPVASQAHIDSALTKEKVVTGVNVQVGAEGFVFTDEQEFGYDQMLALILKGEPVEIKLYHRNKGIPTGADAVGKDAPYLTANFILTSLNLTAPAKDDSTYSLQAENTGEITVSNNFYSDFA